MPDGTTVAIVLVVAGVLCVLAGGLGSLFWYDGKPRAEIRSVLARVVMVAFGLVLCGVGVWHEQAVTGSQSSPDPNNASRQIEVLKKKLENVELRNEKSLQILIDDYRNVAYRAGLASAKLVIEDCADGGVDSPLSQLPTDASTLCGRVAASLWSVEVVVPLVEDREALRQSLVASGIQVKMAVPRVDSEHTGLEAEGLGIVFPDMIPRRLVCDVRKAFVDHTGVDLTTALPMSLIRGKARSDATIYAIQVGVEMAKFFDLSEYVLLDGKEWANLCGGNYTQTGFLNRLVEKGEKLPVKLQSTSDGTDE